MRLPHPHDARLRAEITSDATGSPIVELYVVGDQEPTVRYAADEDEGWDPAGPTPAWQAVELLSSLGFLSVAEIADAVSAAMSFREDSATGGRPGRPSRRMRTVADLLEILGLDG